MKKTLKLLAIVAFMLVMLLSLTGCGGDKLVATKTIEQMGMKYEEKIELSFKNDKVNSMKATMTFDDKETAEEMKALLETTMGTEVEQKGKKLIMKVDAEAYAAGAIVDADMNIEELKEWLEEDGYKVK